MSYDKVFILEKLAMLELTQMSRGIRKNLHMTPHNKTIYTKFAVKSTPGLVDVKVLPLGMGRYFVGVSGKLQHDFRKTLIPR